jgi:WD40 repeat protein
VRGARIAETPLPVQPGPIVTTRFTPDGAQLAVSTNSGSLAVYRTADGAETHSFAGQAGSIGGIDWTGVSRPAGLYTVGLDGDLVSWDLGSGPRLLAERGPDYPAPKLTDLFGTQIVGMSQVPNTPNSTRRIYTVNARTGDSASWPAGLIDANGRTQGMAQITASGNGTYGLADIGGIYGSVAGHNRVEIFDLRAHRDVGHLVLPGTDFFPDGYFAVPSPDGRRAYCNCSPSHDRVDVFALPSGKLLTSFRVRFPGPAAGQLEPECWRFDPAGRLVVFGWSPQGLHQRIGVVDVVSHRLIAQTDLGTAPPLTAIAWSHDLRTVAVGTAEGTVAIYDAATLSVRTKPIIATSGNVNSLSFAPDDQALVVGGTDGAVRFLNLPDLTPEGERLSIGGYGGPLWAWYAPNGDVFGLAPDTRRPNGQDVRWFTLHVATPSLVASACQLAGADITRAQWQRYVGDRPYEHVCPARH